MTHSLLIEAMKKPDFYSHHPAEIEVIKKHIFKVFIAGALVYKVKKPVNSIFSISPHGRKENSSAK